MSAVADLAEYYRVLGAGYDRRRLSLERLRDESALEAICRNELTGRNVLEVACGTGRWTARLCRYAAHITALDINHEMLHVARQRNQDAHNVSFIQADALELPPFKHNFTGAFAGWWLSHVPRQRMQHFLHRLHALLAPGAIVVFTDDTVAVQERLSGTDESGNTYATRTASDRRIFQILKNFYTEDQLRALVKEDAVPSVTYFEGNLHWALHYELRGSTPKC